MCPVTHLNVNKGSARPEMRVVHDLVQCSSDGDRQVRGLGEGQKCGGIPRTDCCLDGAFKHFLAFRRPELVPCAVGHAKDLAEGRKEMRLVATHCYISA